jgi:RNA-directed DNA polymerase
MSPELDRLTELAQEDPKRQFFSIAHLITPEALYTAFGSLRKDASAGVDGVTYGEYQKDAERNIQKLYQRLKEGKYQANRSAGSTYRRRRGSRDRSRFPLWRTRSCRRRWW